MHNTLYAMYNTLYAAWQVDLLYVHNAAESHLAALGKRRFLAALKLAFAAMEKFRC